MPDPQLSSEPVIPDLRLVEPPADRNPPPLPYPGPESPDTYQPTIVQWIRHPNADGSMPAENPSLDAWFQRAAEVRARSERDPAYQAYVTSYGF